MGGGGGCSLCNKTIEFTSPKLQNTIIYNNVHSDDTTKVENFTGPKGSVRIKFEIIRQDQN